MTTTRQVPEKFLVAFSFAGEQRDLVRSVAEAVEQRLGHGTVFYDDWFLSYIAGDGGDLRLMNVYRKRATLVVPCVSERYGGKPWTKAEHRAIRELQQQIDGSKEEKAQFRIMPLRVGDGDIDELPSVTICHDARTLGIEASADLIIDRLRLTCPGAGHRVFLAECGPELTNPTKPINRDAVKAFLEERGWIVEPRIELAQDQNSKRIEEQLRQCVAFVELLGTEPWSPGGVDVNESAKKLKLKRLRFCSTELDRSAVASPHRENVFGNDVIVAGMDDFLKHLEKELNETLLHQQELPSPQDNAPPLVRVAKRSSRETEHWDQVFKWLFEQENIRVRALKAGESLPAIQKSTPCHGFVVICDESTPSIDELMEQCEELQLSEKNPSRRLPVAIVYWPPPSPVPWSRLLNIQPVRLHRIAGDAPTNLTEFIADVWQVRKVMQ